MRLGQRRLGHLLPAAAALLGAVREAGIAVAAGVDVRDMARQLAGMLRASEKQLRDSRDEAARRGMDFDERVNALVTQAEEDQICWVEFSSDGKKLALRSAPLDVGPLVEEHLWFGKKVVVMAAMRGGFVMDVLPLALA